MVMVIVIVMSVVAMVWIDVRDGRGGVAVSANFYSNWRWFGLMSGTAEVALR